MAKDKKVIPDPIDEPILSCKHKDFFKVRREVSGEAKTDSYDTRMHMMKEKKENKSLSNPKCLSTFLWIL